MSIVEIARTANVSISTVSRFFNKPESLSPQIAAKIEKVVAQTNYRPRIVRPGPKAASRVGIRTGVIALVSLCDFSLEQLWRLPVLPILIGSVQSTLLRRQLSLFFGNLDKDGRLPECVSSRRCDGVIFFSKPPTPKAAAGFRKSLPDLPTVWCFRDHADEEHRFDHIFYDNSAVGPIAAEYLASHGHRKVAFFNTDPTHSAFGAREIGFCERARSLGLEPVVFKLEHPEREVQKNYRKLAADFLQNSTGITGAFFCVDHDMLGIHIELLAAGYPARNLDMIGCNADEVALQYLSPRPATIDIKISQIGQMAVDQLLRRINGESCGAVNEIFVKPELIKGER